MLQILFIPLRTLCFAILCAAFFSQLVYASAPSPATTTGPTYRASLIDFIPTGYSEGNEYKGSYIDLLQAIEKRTGIKFEVQTFPFL